MPRSAAVRRLNIKPRSWSSPWSAQLVTRCSTCRRRRPVMLVENDALVCAGCHEERLRQWRLDDEAAECREALWSAWDLATGRGPR
jgi:hypothetical protein